MCEVDFVCVCGMARVIADEKVVFEGVWKCGLSCVGSELDMKSSLV